ncbi:NAD(P)-dependent oxidoreductase [Lacrimispora sp. NSJ-141]|uniref:NAD(P)-dependent oxidoreductase n=1 Tax=Lientehia hominis TaxID=2897778 RepID=A0AAP2W8J5_9FIRM|nr:NAD(P)-dependent oxidoreductase [Lientehia hominis]MCD2492280.1 NAD(P)-dependent oxidoreductase [Lientehia hominis]
MRRVVITGCTGMIGNAVLQECLYNQVEVLAIVRPDSRYMERIPKSPFITICECGLENLDTYDFTVYGSYWDVFYHFAWTNTSPCSRNNPETQYVNIRYTLNAVKVSKILGCKKFVGAGSQAEYGCQNVNRLMPETPVNPLTAYGVSKYAAGKLAGLWCSKHEMDCLWCRIFSVYGIYDNESTMISTTINKMLNGERALFTSGTQMWDYLYSEDAGRAFYLIGQRAIGNKVYCVGNGEARPLRDYIEIIRNLINPALEIGIGEIAYEGEPVSLCAGIESLKEDTGFMPSISFEEGIDKCLKKIGR